MIGITLPPSLEGRFPRVICGSNPGGPGHNWVKGMFIDEVHDGQVKQMTPKEGGFKRGYIRALSADNPTLLRDDPGYNARLEGMGSDYLVRAWKFGDWDIVAGGMFDDVWSRDKQVIPRFVVPRDWQINRSFDWGSSRPFSVGWWAEADGTTARMPDGSNFCPPRGSLIRIAEWYGWNGKANEGLKMLSEDIARGIQEREKTLELTGRVRPGPADSSIYDVVDGNSIAAKMALVGVTWNRANKGPGSRKNGWELMRSLLASSKAQRPEDPGMWVTEGCQQFIRTVPTLPRDSRDPDDVDTKSEDHCGDEVRYRALERRKEFVEGKLVGF